MIVYATITLSPKGEIRVEPDPIRISLDDEIEWVSEFDFAVVFAARSPFNGKVYYKNLRSGRPSVGTGLPPFKYSVFTLGMSCDPEVIVEDPGGGKGARWVEDR